MRLVPHEANEGRIAPLKLYRNSIATHYVPFPERESQAGYIERCAGDWEKVRAFDTAYIAAAPMGERAAGRTVHDFDGAQHLREDGTVRGAGVSRRRGRDFAGRRHYETRQLASPRTPNNVVSHPQGASTEQKGG